MKNVIFIHGMFQNPKSWERWINVFSADGYHCQAPAWPLHEGEPSVLRDNVPVGLGDLTLNNVLARIEAVARHTENPILIGHSVGGLIVQLLLNRGVGAAGVAINSVAPNGMIDLHWSFVKNIATIANPLKGDEPVYMDAETFHEAFANTLTADVAAQAFENYATHDSRNVLRGCMGSDGHVDLDRPHAPLLMIAGAEDQIIPASLNEKNFKAYSHKGSLTTFKAFPDRSHYICGEPGWEDVASYTKGWLDKLRVASNMRMTG